MDDILFSFVQENIENLNKDELIDLLDLINIDDENLNKFKLGLKTNIEIKENRITNLFKNFFYEK